jgi:hypothetical protein
MRRRNRELQNMQEETDEVFEARMVVPTSHWALRLARLSWQTPLVCLGVSFFINLVAKPIGIIGGVIFIGGVVVGLILSIVAAVAAIKYRRGLLHAAAGLVTNILLALAIAGMLHAINLHREFERKEREKQQSVSRGQHLRPLNGIASRC